MQLTNNSSKSASNPLLSKSGLIGWLRSVVSDTPNNLKIEDLGTGVVWCKLINVYYPLTIQSNRIILNPKNQYENTNNLKLLQNALVQLKISVPFDLSKVAKMKFLENWALANSLHKHFNVSDINQTINDDSKSNQGQIGIKTPKRTFQMAFMSDPQQYQIQRKDSQRQLRENSTITNTIYQLNNPNLKSSTAVFNNIPMISNSPLKGKWSVGSQFFQNNQYAIIDRVKQILLKSSHDIEKIRQIKILLNIPLDEDIVKIEEEQINVKVFKIQPTSQTQDAQKSKTKNTL